MWCFYPARPHHFPKLPHYEQDPENSFAWGSNSLPTRREHSIVLASDMEVLTLIPTASYSAANRPSACWRSRSDVANRTTSSAKSRDKLPRSPNRTLSSAMLHLEILSMKFTNGIGDKGQPWWSPTLTENELDSAPRIWAQLSLCLYKDRDDIPRP